MASLTRQMATFFESSRFAVVGASIDKKKFGNRVLCWYLDHNKPVTPVHPKEREIEGIAAVPSLADLTGEPTDVSVSVITPPAVTKGVLEQGVAKGITKFWLQPGAEFPGWQAFADEHKVLVIAQGPCVLRDAKL
ncbi:hypothetical protein GGF31_004377 [Allomyces arbusculus]|nr:hypothetical protein GGF31_004377 [Allomyces arbusculus]